MSAGASSADDVPAPGRRGTLLQKLAVAVIGALAAANCLVITSHWGAGVTTDSVRYIAAARHLSDGVGLITHNGTPLVEHPPLYPVLLAAIDRVLAVDPVVSARFVGALLMGAIVYLAGLLMLGHLRRSPWLALLSAALVALAGPLFQASIMVWSESLFVVLSLVCLIGIESYVRRGDARALALMSVSAALACLTRYIGGALVLTGVASILLLGRGASSVRWKHALVFALASSVPLGLWFFRSLALTGTLLGARPENVRTLSDNLERAYVVVVGWFAYGRTAVRRRAALLLMGALVVLAALRARGPWGEVRRRLLGLAPVLLFGSILLAALVVSASTSACGKLTTRHLSPVFVPSVLLLAAFTRGAIGFGVARSAARMLVGVLAVVALVVLMLGPVGLTAVVISRYAEDEGVALHSKRWRGSEMALHLVGLRRAAPVPAVYSNEPATAYFLSGVVTKKLPTTWQHRAQDGSLDLSALVGAWPPEGNARLVWFAGRERPMRLGLRELRSIADLERVALLGEGMIYDVRGKTAGATRPAP